MVGAKGLDGRLKVEPLTDRPERLDVGAEVFLEGESVPRAITRVEAPGRVRVVALAGIATREEATRLVGSYLEVEADELPPETYYWHELVGLSVVDASGRSLGTIREVFRAGENEVYRVVGPAGETLIPALRRFVVDLDVKAGRMVVALEAEEFR